MTVFMFVYRAYEVAEEEVLRVLRVLITKRLIRSTRYSIFNSLRGGGGGGAIPPGAKESSTKLIRIVYSF